MSEKSNQAAPLCVYIKSEPEDQQETTGGRSSSDGPEKRSTREVECSPPRWPERPEENPERRAAIKENGKNFESIFHETVNSKKEFNEFEMVTDEAVAPAFAAKENISETRSEKKFDHSTVNKRVQCPVCLKLISCAYKLKEHLTVHTGVKPYNCHCGKTFRLKSTLTDHLEIHKLNGNRRKHGTPHKIKVNRKLNMIQEGDGFVCSECGKMFKKMYLLKQHFRSHSDDRPYVCDACDKSFKSKGHLIDHMDSHTTGQPFMCSKCGNCFKRASCLKCHARNGHCSADSLKTRKLRSCGSNFRKTRKPKETKTIKPAILKAFPCDLCSTSYSNIKNLYTHKRYVHRAVKMHRCQYCEKDFRDKFLKVQHERVHTGERPFECNICRRSFNTRSYLKKHTKLCSGARGARLKCGNAPEDLSVATNTVAQLWDKMDVAKMELDEHSPLAPLEEVLCKYSDSEAESNGPETIHDRATSSLNPNLDRNQTRDIPPSDSIEIKLEFTETLDTKNNIVLIKHIDPSKRYACDQCGKTFKKTATLNNHILTHSDKLYSCDKCGKTFSRPSYLSGHMKIHSRTKSHRCGQCGRCFTTNMDLRSHSRTHTGERPYSCETCRKTFGYRASLNYHKRTHLESPAHRREERFKCSQCDKSYLHKKTLEMHKTTHTGERPYRCKECGKSFVWPNNLKTHAKSHAAEKPYVCGKCGKGFARKDTLRFHAATHSEDRPLVCHQCGKGFFRASSLATHVKTHVEVRPLACEQCGRRFALPNGLKKHMETHLKIKKRKVRSDELLQVLSY